MNSQQILRISKFLSKHLRHNPEAIGLSLQPGGWVAIADLLAGAAAARCPITREQLQIVVEQNDKQRFSIDPESERIRANQGHSVPVDLEWKATEPPEILYHGTARKNEASILESGLDKMRRHHVHLSVDTETALRVGQRHGKPLIFRVAAGRMRADGFVFYRSENGVWLVDCVPPEFLELET